MNEVYEFLKKCGTYYLATVEGDQPRVRPFGTVNLFEGRGAAALCPENTIPSFEKALELGVDAYEFDIWLTSDKVPVIMHDGNPLRTCGVNGHLRDMTYAEV